EDTDGSGDIDGGESTKVCATKATVSISGNTGTLSFSGCSYAISASSAVDFVLSGDIDNLVPGDSFTIDLGPSNVTLSAGTIGGSDATTTSHTVDGSDAYHFRKRITIDKDQVGTSCSSNLSNFPLMISLTGSAFAEIGDNTGYEGYDLIFKDADGNQLDHEIEEYDESTDNRLVAWVRIPTLYYDKDTVIYMYYGNSSVASATENPNGVWDDNYMGVWHLTESGNGTADEYQDSTQYGNHGQGGEGDTLYVPAQTAGKIGYGQDFNDSDTKWDFIDVGNDSTLDITGNKITLQCWVKHNITPSSGDWNGILNHKGWSNGYRILLPDNSLKLNFQLPGSSYSLTSAADVTAGAWHLLMATYDGSNMKIYIDGSKDTNELSKTDNIISVPPTENDVWIGHGDQPEDVAWSYEWEGRIDEVRISDIDRPQCWIETEYNNMNSPATFYDVGNEENLNYLYRKKITIDTSTIGTGCSADLTDFPYMITLTGNDFKQVEDNVDADGYDIIFKTAAGVQLDHEIETYDESNDVLVAWVRIPILDYDDDTVLYTYYGNPSVTAATENPTGVWDDNYLGVWHLKEDPSGTAPQMKNSTSNTNHGTSGGSMTTGDQVSGKIGGSLDFDGSNDEVDFSDAIIGDSTAWTITAWIKMGTDSAKRTIYSEGDTGAEKLLWLSVDDSNNYARFYYANPAGTWTGNIDGSTNVEDSQYHYVTMVQRTKTDRQLYVDTGSEGTNTDNPGTLTHDTAGIGILRCSYDTDYFKGIIDEVRVSDIDRGACWMQTEYNNQNAPTSAYTVDPEEGLNYLYRKKITINYSQIDTDCAADLSDFPVMVLLTGTNFTEIEDDVDASGYAMNFKAEGDATCGGAGTAPCVLDHEIELYDTTNNKLVAWVRIPTLDYNDNTVIYLHYGNPNVTASTDGSQTLKVSGI
ncbi:MAG: DUF2341 domain-containing protein, partial [Planctomycetota bacterium]